MAIYKQKNLWVCISKIGKTIAIWSFASTKKEAKAKFLDGGQTSWEFAKAGWQCIKVDITLNAKKQHGQKIR